MRGRKLAVLAATTVLAGLAGIAGVNAWIIRSARGRIFHDVMSAPSNDIALVLGTSSKTDDGEPNAFFTGRMETAARLYDAGKVRHFLLSGADHPAGENEPEEMRQALLMVGVPDRALTLDGAGVRTLQSMARARAPFGLSRFTIITDDFHAARALFLAKHYDLDAIAVCSRPVPLARSARTRLREIASRCRAWLDVYVLRDPPRSSERAKSLEVVDPEMKTTADRVAEFGDAVRTRMLPFFKQANIPYPPARLALVGLKEERELQLYAANTSGNFRFIRSFPVLAASGQAGPKLREGDRQVPEGIYRVELLHPNSRYHLALRVNYPNEFDRAQAEREGRTEPGTDIMIHGGDSSTGCLAIGDEAAEDVFVTAALSRARDIPIIISPVDLRERDFAPPSGAPRWTEQIYAQLRAELARYPKKPLLAPNGSGE